MAEAAALAAHEALAANLLRDHAGDGAEVLERLPPREGAVALAHQEVGIAAGALGAMAPLQAAPVLREMSPGQSGEVLAAIAAPRAASILAWLDPPAREELLERTDARTSRELRNLLSYPPDTAGALMDPRVVTVRESETAASALEKLRLGPRMRRQMYVVDDNHQLVGLVSVQDLALAPAGQGIGRSLERPAPAIGEMATREEVVELLTRTGLPAIAVVDAEERLVGVLRHRELVGAAEGEALADLQQMVGAGKDERALSPIFFAVRKRLPWLQINLLTAFLAASVVGMFEATIAQVTSLAVLLPVVAGQSGNGGAQALAVTMRGLALREVRSTHWRRLATKEVMVGAVNGIAVAVICGIGVLLWSGSPPLAGVISTAMVVSMAAAGLAGASIPLVLRALGQDPAQSSSIILTTVTDVVGFLSFLGLAAFFVSHL